MLFILLFSLLGINIILIGKNILIYDYFAEVENSSVLNV